MTTSPPNLESLATYLEPRFGNVYEIGFEDTAYVDEQNWTPELAEAVKHYLLHEVSDDDYRRFLHELDVLLTDDWLIPDDSRETQVRDIVDYAMPWQVAHAFHLAAVKAIPTLDQLIGHLETWPYENDKDDAALWLEAHTNDEQLRHLTTTQLRHLVATGISDYPDRYDRPGEPGMYRSSTTAEDIVALVSPPELLNLWHEAVEPVPSDLTDAEWQLLRPVFAQRRNNHGTFAVPTNELASARRKLNGVRWHLANGGPWSAVPPRYGRPQTIHIWYRRHQKHGTFARMLAPLEHNPDAARVVEWLRAIAKPDQPDSPTTQAESHNHQRPTNQSSGPSIHAVRTWARSQGYTIADRGRIPCTVMQAYGAVQPAATARDTRPGRTPMRGARSGLQPGY